MYRETFEGSRSERRTAVFYKKAENACFKAEVYLYKSEEVNLKKKGFDVTRYGYNDKISLLSTVSWENAFKKHIPPIVSDYIQGKIQTFPDVDNRAQKLYVIAAHANFVKAQTNNE